MDGVLLTVQDLMDSVKAADDFKNGIVRQESQQRMKELIDSLQTHRVFVMRSLIGEYYMDSTTLSRERQEQLIEPYAFSLFLMSLVINSKNDILLFGDELTNLKANHPEIKSNHDTVAVIVGILRTSYQSEKRTTKLVKNAWNTINKYFKRRMGEYATSLIQDWMIREELDAEDHGLDKLDNKLRCGLDIRISDKRVLLTGWVHLQRLRKVLLSLLKKTT